MRRKREEPPAAQAPRQPTPAERAVTRLSSHVALAEWHVTQPWHLLVQVVAGAMQRRPGGSVLVVGGPDVDPWCAALRGAFPRQTVSPVRVDEDPSDVHVRLAVDAPFDVVIDTSDTSARDQVDLFQRVFPHLDKGGIYVAVRMVPLTAEELAHPPEVHLEPGEALPNENVPPEPPPASDLWDLVAAAQAARIRDFEDHLELGVPFRDVAGLGAALHEVHVDSKILRIVNAERVSPKIRESQVAAVLAARPEIGRVVAVTEPTGFDSRATYSHNLPSADPYVRSRFEVPALSLRAYDAPVCSRGQVVTSNNLLLPDTFRHHWARRMENIYVVEKAPLFGTVRRDLSEPEPLPGAYFHLDSEWPGHFGHLMTEQLSRLWAWERAREIEPGLKLLTTLQHDREVQELLPFETQILGAFGITPDDVHVFDAPVRPERLYSATPMFTLPDYAHPDISDLWDRLGDALAAGAVDRRNPERLFVSRRPSLKRSCHNTPEVERFFAEHGFEVVYPEEHPLADQVRMFRDAEVIAGFAGSGLFSSALCPTPKQLITLAPSSYTARNEHLIAAVRGHTLHAVWSTPDTPQPEGSWTQKAFGSSFTFDFDAEGAFLSQVLDSLA